MAEDDKRLSSFAVCNLPDRESPKEQTSSAKIKYVQPSFSTHVFHKEVNDLPLTFTILKMKGSIFIWIGKYGDPVFTDLSVAVTSPLQNTTPLSTKVMGPCMEDLSINIANKLSKKLEKQVFVSCNVILDRVGLPLLYKTLNDEMTNNPDAFV